MTWAEPVDKLIGIRRIRVHGTIITQMTFFLAHFARESSSNV